MDTGCHLEICVSPGNNWIGIVVSYIFYLSLWSTSFDLASLRCGQQMQNIVYFFADKRSKQSSHFNRPCSILCANGSTLFPVFHKHSTIPHTL